MKLFKGKYKWVFFSKLTHWANKFYVKCLRYKTIFLKKKIVHSVNFHLHVESHVNYHSNTLICIIIATENKNHRFNIFPALTQYTLIFKISEKEHP